MKASRNCPLRRLDVASPALKFAAMAALVAVTWLFTFTLSVVLIGTIIQVLP